MFISSMKIIYIFLKISWKKTFFKHLIWDFKNYQ